LITILLIGLVYFCTIKYSYRFKIDIMKSRLLICMLLLTLAGYSQTLTEVIFPQYVQGVGSSNASDDRKVPFACRMTVSGLNPSSTYRFYNRFVADPSLATNGQGNYILASTSGDFIRVTSATLAVAGRYGEFTTDGSGSYTGWFVIEPSLALEFQPGTLLYFRLMLNNGAGGASVQTRVTYTTPVTVLGWGNAANQGTGLRTIPNPTFVPKNFVFFYDNQAGTGRPVSGTFIENDGTDNNAVTSGYAPFYANSVDLVNNTWGTIIPNNMPTGVRRIAQFALSNGNPVNNITTTDGVYPTTPAGTINTANATGGLTELVIAATTVPVRLLNFTANLIDGTNQVKLNWNTSSEINFSKFVVEKSINGSDYTSVAEVSSKGDNSSYLKEDMINTGITYYRLRLVDNDSRFSYSPIRQVELRKSTNLNVYPNPTSNLISVDHKIATTGATIQILGFNGSRISVTNVKEGAIKTSINVSRLTAGKYIVIYTDKTGSEQYQFNKL